MQDDLRFTENVRQIAADAAELALRLCDTCGNFHTLWPYHRLAQAAGGDVAAPLVRSALKHLLSPSDRRILIGGSADSGLLAVVANAASPGTAITVLDRCATPLELCRYFAKRWLLPIDMIHLDLAKLEVASAYDVVFVHMLLQFIPPDHHREVFSRIRRALRPQGRLVLAFRISPRLTDALAAEYRSSYPLGLIEQLDARGIPLPEGREAFARKLEIYFEERRAREGTNASRQDVEKAVEDAGFEIEQLTPIDARMSPAFVQFNSRIGLQRFLMIAAPKDDSI
jgi:SAM-dependent methyltransferase